MYKKAKNYYLRKREKSYHNFPLEIHKNKTNNGNNSCNRSQDLVVPPKVRNSAVQWCITSAHPVGPTDDKGFSTHNQALD